MTRCTFISDSEVSPQLLSYDFCYQDGQQYGDEYLAELDFIEVVERGKEGYESEAEKFDFEDDQSDESDR